jgi:exopolysaccharide production protein ExoY
VPLPHAAPVVVEAKASVSTGPVSSVGRSGLAQILVRIFDVVVAVTGLVVLSPLMLLIAALVVVTSPGPVFYGSPRIGSAKPEFKAWKFRSMYADADHRLSKLLDSDPAARSEYEMYRKLRDDPRIIPVGRIIRTTSLDELPQLFNILRGEMSVVGPRPKLLNERNMFGDSLPVVLSVKPGLTGLWQVSGRNNLTVEERVRLDVKYVEEWSFSGDLVICAKTFVQMWRPRSHGAL